jgi:hypothetical protein
VILWDAVNDERFSFDKMLETRQQRWLASANTLPLLMHSPPHPPITCERVNTSGPYFANPTKNCSIVCRPVPRRTSCQMCYMSGN